MFKKKIRVFFGGGEIKLENGQISVCFEDCFGLIEILENKILFCLS